MQSIDVSRESEKPDGQTGIELRCDGTPLLGILFWDPPRIEIKRGDRLFEVNLEESYRTRRAVIAWRDSHFSMRIDEPKTSTEHGIVEKLCKDP
jgi:hypothetical protein